MTAVQQFGLFDTPPVLQGVPLASVPLGTMVPRDYQAQCMEANDRVLKTHRSVMDVLATGSGKAVIAALELKKRGGGIVIVHRDSLARQLAQKIRHATQEHVGIEKAQQRADGARYVVASMQTLRGKRLQDFAAAHQDVELIGLDECHISRCRSMQSIWDAFPKAQRMGWTATPDRGDKKALGKHFDEVAFTYPIINATADGWLTPGEWQPLTFEGVLLDSIGLKGGDIDQGALDDAVVRCAAEIAKGVIKYAHGDRSLIFCPGVKTAEGGAEALNRLQPGCARAIHGGQPDEEREAIEKGHQRGDFPYLLNCQIYLEGYDDPEIKCIFDFAKTKSRLRWAQKYGRGTRLWPRGIDHLATITGRRNAIAASPKPVMRFYDALYGTHSHDLAGPVDLLGGTYSDEVKREAKRALEKKGGNVADALTEAHARVEENKRRLAAIAAAAARAKGEAKALAARSASELYGKKTRNPFEILGMRDPEHNPWARKLPGPATEPQLYRLRKEHIPIPEGGISKTRASYLIGECNKRRAAGKAEYKQLASLALLGIRAGGKLSFEAAHAMLAEAGKKASLRQPGEDDDA